MIRSRFGAFTPARVVAGDHDLSGRNVIVTGGASGIGYETAKALAAARARGNLIKWRRWVVMAFLERG